MKWINCFFSILNEKYRYIHDLEVGFEDGGEEEDVKICQPYGSKDEANIEQEIKREEEEDEIEDEIEDKE